MVSAPLSNPTETLGADEAGHTLESATSAISWAAIIGGAFATAALSLILLALGSGFGLASVSPWPNSGASVTTFTAMTAAAVIGAAVLASAVSSLMSGGAHLVGTVASGAAEGASRAEGEENPLAYYDDSLFRSDHPDAKASDQDVRAETTRILAAGIRTGDVPAGDKTYLAQLVAAHTGLSQADAEKRVDDVIAKAKAAETKARQIADAARRLAEDVRAGTLKLEHVDEGVFAAYLATTGMPDPDLLIRTSGEMRVSNFLLWQISYSELWVTEILWPDFRGDDLLEACRAFAARERKFGGLPATAKSLP